MTEHDWLIYSDSPQDLWRAMLSPTRERVYTKMSDRRIRLFGCACLRLRAYHCADEVWGSVLRAEHVADGLSKPLDPGLLANPLCNITGPDPFWALPNILDYTESFGSRRADIFREIFGNPWRYSKPLTGKADCYTCLGEKLVVRRAGLSPPDICPTCGGMGKLRYFTEERRWNDDTVGKLAQSIYERQAYEDLPFLADALEEAGSDDLYLVNHCRGKELCPDCLGDGLPHPVPPCENHNDQPKCDRCHGVGWIDLRHPHVRGCWALETVLWNS